MHIATFLYLTLISGLGASGSPLGHEKRQLIPFPQNFPFQSLSGDESGALSAIQSNNLQEFCARLLDGGRLQGVTEDAADILPRQNVNVNSNSNQGGPGGSNSYSYSSSNSDSQSQTDIDYNLNGVSVPKQLTKYRPNTIRNACEESMGGAAQNPQPTGIPAPIPAPASASPVPFPASTPGTAPPINPFLPNPVPSPAPGPLQPGIYFQNAFYGIGDDSPIHPIEQPGLPPVPYVPGQFHTYRFACAELSARTADALAFSVNTDFKTNHCNLIFGQEVDVQSGDIVPQQTVVAYHLEVWNRVMVE